MLLLVLFVLGQAYAHLHHCFVQHSVCPVDGQVAHGDHEHGLADPRDHDQPVALTTDSDRKHGEHCSVPDPREERKGLLGSAPVATEPAKCVSVVRVLRSQDVGIRIPLYRLAPKQSPPHAA